MSEIVIAILAGLGGMLGWGFADFFAKKTIDRIGDIASLAWGHVFGTGALLLVVVYETVENGKPITFPHDIKTYLFLFLFGTLQAVIYLLLYKGFGKGQISILNPIFASFSGITAALSILLCGERVSISVLVGLGTLFVGIILISADIGALRSRRFSFAHVPGFKEVARATLLAALWTLLWGKFLNGEDALISAFCMYASMTLVILTIARAQSVNLHAVTSSVWKFLVLIGSCEAVAYAAISLGYSYTSHISVVALLSGAFSLPVIILARIFLKERITTSQTVGSLVIIGGIMLLAWR